MKKILVPVLFIVPLLALFIRSYSNRLHWNSAASAIEAGGEAFERSILENYKFTAITNLQVEELQKAIHSQGKELSVVEEESLTRRLHLFLRAYHSGAFDDVKEFRFPLGVTDASLSKYFIEELNTPYETFPLNSNRMVSIASQFGDSQNVVQWPLLRRLELNYCLKTNVASSGKTLTCISCLDALALGAIKVKVLEEKDYRSAEGMFVGNPEYGSMTSQAQLYILNPSIDDVVRSNGQVKFAWVYLLMRLNEGNHIAPVVLNLYWVPKENVWLPIQIIRSNSSYPTRFLF